MPMTENGKKWVAALRSGEFKQADGALYTSRGYCCLGVACELAERDGVLMAKTMDPEGGCTIWDGEGASLPLAVQKWLGVTSDDPKVKIRDRAGEPYSLAEMNDSGIYNFEDIAKAIEENEDDLFR